MRTQPNVYLFFVHCFSVTTVMWCDSDKGISITIHSLTASIADTCGDTLWAGTHATVVYCVYKCGTFWNNCSWHIASWNINILKLMWSSWNISSWTINAYRLTWYVFRCKNRTQWYTIFLISQTAKSIFPFILIIDVLLEYIVHSFVISHTLNICRNRAMKANLHIIIIIRHAYHPHMTMYKCFTHFMKHVN